MADTTRAVLTASLDAFLTKASATSPASSTSGRKRTFGAYSQLMKVLDADSFPPLNMNPVDLSKTLAATTFDFDLTAAPAAEEIADTIDLTGGHMIGLIYVFADGNNAAGMTLGPHPTTNAYAPFGTGIIPRFYPGMVGTWFFKPRTTTFTPGTPAVASGAKALRLTGTVGDILQAIALFGDP